MEVRDFEGILFFICLFGLILGIHFFGFIMFCHFIIRASLYMFK